MALICAECLGTESDEPTEAATVFSGLALCDEHYGIILEMVEQAQRQAQFGIVRPN